MERPYPGDSLAIDEELVIGGSGFEVSVLVLARLIPDSPSEMNGIADSFLRVTEHAR
jgi:hypothetical protein